MALALSEAAALALLEEAALAVTLGSGGGAGMLVAGASASAVAGALVCSRTGGAGGDCGGAAAPVPGLVTANVFRARVEAASSNLSARSASATNSVLPEAPAAEPGSGQASDPAKSLWQKFRDKLVPAQEKPVQASPVNK